MPISVTASELIKVAVSIERRGIAFYDVMAQSVQNTEMRSLFQYLANWERQHLQVFQNMLSEADKYPSIKINTEEHSAYIQALSDSAVFTDDLITSELATRAENNAEALELAIGAEKDSILFYFEMKETMPESTYPLVDKVINEEKSHLKLLNDLKRNVDII